MQFELKKKRIVTQLWVNCQNLFHRPTQRIGRSRFGVYVQRLNLWQKMTPAIGAKKNRVLKHKLTWTLL